MTRSHPRAVGHCSPEYSTQDFAVPSQLNHEHFGSLAWHSSFSVIDSQELEQASPIQAHRSPMLAQSFAVAISEQEDVHAVPCQVQPMTAQAVAVSWIAHG